MKRTLIIFLLLAVGVNAVTYNYTTIEAYATVCDKTPYLNITAFSALPSPAYTDQLVIFSISNKNEGNCYTMNNVSLYINVYSSAGINVWNNSKTSDSGLMPASTWTTEFYSAYFGVDTYMVNLSAHYTVVNFSGQVSFNGSTNASLNMTVTTRPTTPTITPSGGGGMPPTIPRPLFVQFHKYPVLQEVAPGSLIVVDLSLKNPMNTQQTIGINLTGIPPNWLNLFENSVTMGPYETKTVSFTINVPENADSGDYLAKADIADRGLRGYSYFVIRVKKYPDNYLAPQVYRRVDLDFVDNTSSVTIVVQNDENPHKRVDIYEKIPKILSDNINNVDFETPPTDIVQADPIVMFSMENMRPDEKRSIDYTIRNVVDQYEPYVYWPIEQINILYEQGMEKVRISNTFQSVMGPGGDSNYLTFDVGNIYTDTLNVTISLWLPAGWNSSPASVFLTIPPYAQTRVNMKIDIPLGTASGGYYGGMYVLYDNSSMTKEIVFRVQELGILGGIYGIFGFLSENGLLAIIIVAVLIIVVVRTIRIRRRYEYKEDMATTLSEIKSMVFRRRR